jgi:hypothetical protein
MFVSAPSLSSNQSIVPVSIRCFYYPLSYDPRLNISSASGGSRKGSISTLGRASAYHLAEPTLRIEPLRKDGEKKADRIT